MFYFLPVQSKSASIAGLVTLKGAPQRNVAVSLTPIESDGSWDPSQVRRTKTDGAGRFQFKSLKAGNYVVAAMTPGYLIPSGNNVVHRGKPVTLAEDESLDDVAFEIVRSAVITGRVTDAGGEPVAEEPITLWRLNDQGTPGIFELIGMPNARATDDRGIYRLYGLPAGRYQVSVGQVQREGIIVSLPSRSVFYPTTFYPDATNASQAKVIEVSEGDEATGVDINIGRLRKTQDLFGLVVDADTGHPMAGKDVGYTALAGDPSWIRSLSINHRSDAQGAFHLSNLIPGRYSIFAIRSRDDEHYGEPVEVEVGDETVTGVEIRMRRGASVSGVMVIEGAKDPALQREIPLVSLQFYPVPTTSSAAPISGRAVRTSADGRFTAKGLEPGTHRIRVNGGPSNPRASLLRVERSGGSHPEEITLQAGEQATDVRVVIAFGNATIRGQLKVTGGSLPDGVQLLAGARRAETSGMPGTSVYVDPSGQFVIKDLVPGEYDLILGLRSSGDPQQLAQLAQLAERLSKTRTRVRVEANREMQVVIQVDLGRKEGDQ